MGLSSGDIVDTLVGTSSRAFPTGRWLAAVGVGLAVVMSFATMLGAERRGHVHVADRDLSVLMERGMAGSKTFRTLVEQLDAAPIQVLVSCNSFMPDSLSGRLQFISSVGGVRYVQVTIRCSLAPRRQLAFLAHEFQHALEIAENPEIADADSMESYYADIGFATRVDGVERTFETAAAVAMQHLVDREMNEKPELTDDKAATGAMATQP